jgi:hypothetical protein
MSDRGTGPISFHAQMLRFITQGYKPHPLHAHPFPVPCPGLSSPSQGAFTYPAQEERTYHQLHNDRDEGEVEVEEDGEEDG